MKKCVILILLVATMEWPLQAQDSLYFSSPPSRQFVTTLTLDDPQVLSREFTLVEVRDSSVVLSPLVLKKDFSPAMMPLTEVYFFDIENINVYRKNRAIRYGLAGLAAGAALGVVASLSQSDLGRDDQWFNMSGSNWIWMSGVSLAILGGIGGALVGPMIEVNFPIKGSLLNFGRQKPRLVQYQTAPYTHPTVNMYPGH